MQCQIALVLKPLIAFRHLSLPLVLLLSLPVLVLVSYLVTYRHPHTHTPLFKKIYKSKKANKFVLFFSICLGVLVFH